MWTAKTHYFQGLWLCICVLCFWCCLFLRSGFGPGGSQRLSYNISFPGKILSGKSRRRTCARNNPTPFLLTGKTESLTVLSTKPLLDLMLYPDATHCVCSLLGEKTDIRWRDILLPWSLGAFSIICCSGEGKDILCLLFFFSIYFFCIVFVIIELVTHLVLVKWLFHLQKSVLLFSSRQSKVCFMVIFVLFFCIVHMLLILYGWINVSTSIPIPVWGLWPKLSQTRLSGSGWAFTKKSKFVCFPPNTLQLAVVLL